MSKVIGSVVGYLPAIACGISFMVFVLSLGYAILPNLVPLMFATMLVGLAIITVYLSLKRLSLFTQTRKSNLNAKNGVSPAPGY